MRINVRGLNGEEAEFYAWRGYARFLLSPDRKHAFEDCAGDCRKAIKMVDRCLPAHRHSMDQQRQAA